MCCLPFVLKKYGIFLHDKFFEQLKGWFGELKCRFGACCDGEMMQKMAKGHARLQIKRGLSASSGANDD